MHRKLLQAFAPELSFVVACPTGARAAARTPQTITRENCRHQLLAPERDSAAAGRPLQWTGHWPALQRRRCALAAFKAPRGLRHLHPHHVKMSAALKTYACVLFCSRSLPHQSEGPSSRGGARACGFGFPSRALQPPCRWGLRPPRSTPALLPRSRLPTLYARCQSPPRSTPSRRCWCWTTG